jgi:trehalose 6-phosphate phosphatase
VLPILPPLERTALLLDFDGTLVDIAPAPDKVVVPPGLYHTLRGLRPLLGDALAVITGRPVDTVDALLGDAPFAVAGEHGAAIRHAPSEKLVRPPLPLPPESWAPEVERLASAHPGTLVEQKPHGFTLHFRTVPSAGPVLRDALTEILAGSAEFELLPAHMAWEVRPSGTDKGKAVAIVMARLPFRGKLPVFIGDDVTDEDGIAAAHSFGGVGLRVPESFGDAAAVRAWLHASVSLGRWS